MTSSYKIIIALLLVLLNGSACKKFLEEKPEKTLIVPNSLNDCKMILQQFLLMNQRTSAYPELLSDNFYASYNSWSNFYSKEEKAAYIFEPQAETNTGNWYQYQTVFNANTVLQILEKINPPEADRQTWNALKGAALFFRAYSFYHLAQLYALPYDEATAGKDLGIPLRLSPDLTETTTRSSVAETYEQIIADLTEAVSLLPEVAVHPTQPNKAAAHGMLSRTYLMMRNYPLALKSATGALTLQPALLDYNQVSAFEKFNNPEISFYGVAGVSPLIYYYGHVSPALYYSYADNDLRKTLFFTDAVDTGHVISGSYASEYGMLFCGMATDELYLNRAECYARAGQKDLALTDLNTLLRKRYDASFTDVTAATAEEALAIILTEREKELVYRNIRWSDIRRLNKEGKNITIKRTFPDNPATYSLPPNDLRYAILIPNEVIDKSGIPQNPR